MTANGDTITGGVTETSTGALASATVGIDPIVPSAATGSGLGNYTIVYVNGWLTVNPAPLTIMANNTSQPFGTTPSLSASYIGLVNGDTAASLTAPAVLSTTATGTSPPGSYAITVSGASSADYSITYKSNTFTVTPASLTITANLATEVYGGPLPTLTASYSGFVNNDTAANLTTQPILTTVAITSSPVLSGGYNISVSGASDPNYTISYIDNTLTVNPATLTITANNDSKTYGALKSFSGTAFTETGLVTANGDTITGGVTETSTGALASATVGIDPIVPSAATGSGLDNGNYTIVYVNGWLTVNPAPLTIMANNTSQPFGSTPSLSASYIGLVNGDTAASLAAPAVLSTTATGTSLPGTYPITVSGASSADYSITYNSGTFTVQQSPTFSSLEGPILRASVTSPVTFTVDVSSSAAGSVPLTGVVAFYDQAQMIGTVPVVNGIATLSTSALAVGDYMVYAMYQGDTNYEPSSTGTITQMVMSTAPAAPVKRATPIPAHPKKAAPKPKAPAPKPKAHPVVKPKAHPATKPRAAVPVKTHVKPAVVRTKR